MVDVTDSFQLLLALNFVFIYQTPFYKILGGGGPCRFFLKYPENKCKDIIDDFKFSTQVTVYLEERCQSGKKR